MPKVPNSRTYRARCVLSSTPGSEEALGWRRATTLFPRGRLHSNTGTDLSLTSVAWQQPGTGDSYLSFAILYGTFVGTGGGSALAGTDLAGCLIRAQ